MPFTFRPHRLVAILAVTVFVSWASLALAAQPDPSAPGNHLLITQVDVVVDGGITTFTIKGENFSFVNLSDLVVTLGGFGELDIPGVPTDIQTLKSWRPFPPLSLLGTTCSKFLQEAVRASMMNTI